MAKSQIAIKREYVRMLMRREYHLRQRIAQAEIKQTGLSYDRHEAAALHWAIGVLNDLLDVQEARAEIAITR